MFHQNKMLALVLVAVTYVWSTVNADGLPPSCEHPVYCDSPLLHHVQVARLYPDSKTFVDLQMRNNENDTLTAFQQLLNETNDNPSRDQLTVFVDTYFKNSSELDNWSPPDYSENPKFLNIIRDEQLRNFAKSVHAIWPTLGRKISDEVLENPRQFSLIPVSHGFIVPGGRFKEIYYWDTFWIVKGLLISGMDTTVKGMLENLIELLNTIGHIPNGSRWYYQMRSQPPLLVAMMSMYLTYTDYKDIAFLKNNIASLEKELNYWLDTHLVTFEKDSETFSLLRYYVPSAGPRPESYFEDYNSSLRFDSAETQQEFYVDVKSAAESGWDFSTRWFIDGEGGNSGNLQNIHTRYIIPVDLNAIYANAMQNLANFYAKLGKARKAIEWSSIAKRWRKSIESVFWNEEEGIWLDYDISNNKHRKFFYPSNFAPLWMGVVRNSKIRKHGLRVMQYLRKSGALEYPGGIPTSLIKSGEQWDLPNAWPPLQSILVTGLEAIGTEDSKSAAFDIAQTWVRACYKGYSKSQQMFEKYDAEEPGKFGGGGEYTVQEGFGWSNGIVLEFLARYGKRMTAYD